MGAPRLWDTRHEPKSDGSRAGLGHVADARRNRQSGDHGNPYPRNARDFRMNLSRETEQREGLHRMIVPSVQSSPGFVAGTGALDPETAESGGVGTVESEPGARALALNLRAKA